MGCTGDHWGGRTAPSAGATYPLEVYVVVGNVCDLSEGIYKPHGHKLEMVAEGDKRAELCDAALGQRCIRDGAIVIVFSAVYERTTGRYKTPVRDERTGASHPRGVSAHGSRARRSERLSGSSILLGTVVVGAFSDGEVSKYAGRGAPTVYNASGEGVMRDAGFLMPRKHTSLQGEGNTAASG